MEPRTVVGPLEENVGPFLAVAQAAPLSKLKTWLDSANYRNIMSASSTVPFPARYRRLASAKIQRERERGGDVEWRHPATRKSADSWISGFCLPRICLPLDRPEIRTKSRLEGTERDVSLAKFRQVVFDSDFETLERVRFLGFALSRNYIGGG